MTYKLFLDDERFPVENDWIIVRNHSEFLSVVKEKGLPNHISFDHDLGENKTGFDCAKFIVEYVLDNDLKMDFTFYVHSQNPIGKFNILSYLNNAKENTNVT